MKALEHRDPRIDFLRAVAILLVLIIHSSTRYTVRPGDSLAREWFALFSRPTIAIFVFISGYLFRGQGLDAAYLFHRLERVLLPYLCFSLLAFFARFKLATFAYFSQQPLDALSSILLGRAWEIYYFVFVIVVLYLLGFFLLQWPFLQKHLCPFVLVLLVINLLHGAYLESLWGHFQPGSAEALNLYRYRSPLVWAFFFFFGFLVRREGWLGSIQNHARFIRAAWVAIFLIYNVLYFSRVPNIDGYDSVIGTIYSLGTIGLLFTFDFSSAGQLFISKISYYLYLSHIFFVYGLGLMIRGLHLDFISPLWLTLLSLVVSFVGPVLLWFPLKALFGKTSSYFLGA